MNPDVTRQAIEYMEGGGVFIYIHALMIIHFSLRWLGHGNIFPRSFSSCVGSS